MLRHTRGRRIRQALPAILLPLAFASCDRFLVEPADGFQTSLALSLSPTSPSFAIAPSNADSIRVQVVDDGGILFDEKLPFDPALDEVLVPVRFTGSEAGVVILVEISDGALPLLRGSGTAQLVQRRLVETEIDMEEAFVEPLESIRSLAAGIYHSCGVGDNDLTACWGVNDEGQLGDRTLNPAPIAIPTDEFNGFYSVSAGLLNTCALAGEGEGYCWGSNRYGGLGVGASTEFSATPLEINDDLLFNQISVGGLHTCGLSYDGIAYCWGFNRWGQVGDGSTTTRFTPVPVSTQLRFESISAGYAHTCGVVAEVGVYCWGLNDFGQLGDGSNTDRTTPTRVVGVQVAMLEVSAGGLHTCGLASGGAAYCWGFNRVGQLGNNGTDDSSTPQPVGASFSSIEAGGLHTCGIGAGNEAWCWGFNRSGAVGDGTSTNRMVPTQVSGSHAYLQLAAGLHHTCGVTVDRNVLCWGYNRFGQVGDGTNENRLLPEDVLTGDRFFYYRFQQGGQLPGLLDSMADGTTLD